MSGHHATLLRGTVAALLPDHDVYITDWIDHARGDAGLDQCIDELAPRQLAPQQGEQQGPGRADAGRFRRREDAEIDAAQHEQEQGHHAPDPAEIAPCCSAVS